jgi:hypothetical protein
MLHTLTVQVPDEIYEPMVQEARLRGESLERVALERLRNGRRAKKPSSDLTEEQRADALARLKRHIVSAPHAVGSDNESIDRDLAREYESTHEDQ